MCALSQELIHSTVWNALNATKKLINATSLPLNLMLMIFALKTRTLDRSLLWEDLMCGRERNDAELQGCSSQHVPLLWHCYNRLTVSLRWVFEKRRRLLLFGLEKTKALLNACIQTTVGECLSMRIISVFCTVTTLAALFYGCIERYVVVKTMKRCLTVNEVRDRRTGRVIVL